MMTVAFGFLITAALLGGYLAVGYLRGPDAGSPRARITRARITRAWMTRAWMTRAIHGVIGAIGLVELIVALGRHRALAPMGLGGFGAGAEILLGLALSLGLFVAAAGWRGHRSSGFLVGAHATAAIAGLTLVLAIVSLG